MNARSGKIRKAKDKFQPFLRANKFLIRKLWSLHFAKRDASIASVFFWHEYALWTAIQRASSDLTNPNCLTKTKIHHVEKIHKQAKQTKRGQYFSSRKLSKISLIKRRRCLSCKIREQVGQIFSRVRAER